MRIVKHIFSKVANLLSHQWAEREMSREMEAHPRLLTDKFERRGMSPAGSTLVEVATQALGIGVNTALFTAYDAVALKPLPVRDADGLLRLRIRGWRERRRGFPVEVIATALDRSSRRGRPMAAAIRTGR
jgi:hypothetical protein